MPGPATAARRRATGSGPALGIGAGGRQQGANVPGRASCPVSLSTPWFAASYM